MARALPHLPTVAEWLRNHGLETRRPAVIPLMRPPGDIEPYGCHVSYYEAAFRGECEWGLGEDGVCWCIGRAPPSVRLKTDHPVVVLMRPCASALVPHLRQTVPRLVRDLGYAVIVKNIDERESDQLIAASGAFRPYASDECWHPMAQSDEQTFPEVILSLAGDVLVPYKSNLHRRRARASDEQLVMKLFNGWLTWFLRRHPVWNEWELRPYYSYWLEHGRCVRYEYSFVYEINGTPIGFACGDRVRDNQAQFWTCVVAPGQRIPTRIVYRDFFSAVAADGVQWINLGGSEERSLHRFKTKLGKHDLLRRVHLVCDPGLLGGR